MLHDQAPADLEERLTRPTDELIQDGSPGWVSDCAEDVHMSTAGLRGEASRYASTGLHVNRELRVAPYTDPAVPRHSNATGRRGHRRPERLSSPGRRAHRA